MLELAGHLPAGSRSELVLNAQLQSAISLADYAELADDTTASNYAARLLAAAKAMLPDFDTGHWSRYSLEYESDLHYQDYVIMLLKSIAKRTADPAWQAAADRFALYETQPPLLTGATMTRTTYPLPQDGIRDDLVVRFFLSKISKVALVVDGKAVDGYRLHGGWRTFRWSPRHLGAGTHAVRLVPPTSRGIPVRPMSGPSTSSVTRRRRRSPPRSRARGSTGASRMRRALAAGSSSR